LSQADVILTAAQLAVSYEEITRSTN
jgi:hypothetical protein